MSAFANIFLPSAHRAASPTLLLLHGTGGTETDLVDIGRAIAPGANLFGVRGKVLERGAPRFFRRLAEGVFDLDDLRIRTDELADYIGVASEEHGFDPSNVIALGYSNGANIAASILLQRPGTLKAAVLLRAMVPFVPAQTPDTARVPVLVAAGEHDPIVPRAETERLAALLRAANADVTVAYQNAGHNLTPADINAVASWLAERLARS